VHQRLRRDILWLDRLLVQVIREQAGEKLVRLVHRLERLARLRREGDPGAGTRLRGELGRLDLETARAVTQALTIRFDLRNLAEDRHRVRVLRERDRKPGAKTESVRAAVGRLDAAGVPAAEARRMAAQRRIELVLTAHPTEAKRRSVRRKLARIRSALEGLDQPAIFARERRDLVEDARAAVTGLWQIDLVRVGQPTVQAEVERGLFFGATLWRTVPGLHRELEEALPGPGDDPAPISFGSWIGGDRDGHPLVTASVTEWTLRRHRESALALHLDACEEAGLRLTVSSHLARIPLSVLQAVTELWRRYPVAAASAGQISEREPYRRYLAVIRWRLERTLGDGIAPRPGGYADVEELVYDLRVLDSGLRSARGASMAEATTSPWLRQAHAFGFWLAPLDIRQESSVFVRVMSQICRTAGLCPDYGALQEAERLGVLSLPAPAPDPAAEGDPLVGETMDLLRLVKRVAGLDHGRALGHFIISMTHQASDVLAVLWLARAAGMSPAELPVLRIVPLFETIDALGRAATITEQLLDHPVYRRHLRAQQDLQVVMIGYSDSTKDGGYVAANWGLYRAQEDILETAARHGVRVRFFHGRGGSLGRGGGPAARGILSLPHGSLEEGLRITEQGEVLAERYDDPHIAHRHLEQLLWASLVAAAETPVDLDPEWRLLMEQLSEHAYRLYRELVERPGFLAYFHQATPVDQIEGLPLGSRPARRQGRRTLEHLRAIPWVFAWIQSRHLLPAWYGLGSAIAVVVETRGGAADSLRTMWRQWPFFTALIDNAALALARTELDIARSYADLVIDPTAREDLWTLIHEEHDLARRWILRITGRPGLIDDVPWLEEAIRTRNPTVDVLNYLQIELLRRLRAGGDDTAVPDTIRLTIQGISSGMRTTG
jgi:phosphoenolpyruvate carboxylase